MSNGVECSVDGCGKPAYRAGFCYGHDRRRYRKGAPAISEELRPYGRPPKDVLLDVAIRLADLKPTDDDGWRKAEYYICRQAVRYTLSLPKFKPLADYLKASDKGFQKARERAA